MDRALLFTGAVGVGKTAVALAAGEALAKLDRRVAVIDLDWLGWVWPPGGADELILRNLAVVADNYRAAGVQDLLLARMVLSNETVAAVRDALRIPLRVVRLTAPSATVEARLRRRDSGAELAEHQSEFARYREAVEAVPADIVIENDKGSVQDVAAEVLRDWRL